MRLKIRSNPKVDEGRQQRITAVYAVKVEVVMIALLTVLTYIATLESEIRGNEKIKELFSFFHGQTQFLHEI